MPSYFFDTKLQEEIYRWLTLSKQLRTTEWERSYLMDRLTYGCSKHFDQCFMWFSWSEKLKPLIFYFLTNDVDPAGLKYQRLLFDFWLISKGCQVVLRGFCVIFHLQGFSVYPRKAFRKPRRWRRYERLYKYSSVFNVCFNVFSRNILDYFKVLIIN